MIRKAEEKGMFIGLLPTWGDKVDRQWGVGPVIFNKENAFQYGKWIGNRYKDYPNIIWINGGDRQGGDANFEIWNALANGIKSMDKNHLMTFHPSGGSSSSKWWSVRVDLEKLGWNQSVVWWYNPCTGEVSKLKELTNKGIQELKPTTDGRGNDWILVIDNKDAGFTPPGK